MQHILYKWYQYQVKYHFHLIFYHISAMLKSDCIRFRFYIINRSYDSNQGVGCVLYAAPNSCQLSNAPQVHCETQKFMEILHLASPRGTHVTAVNLILQGCFSWHICSKKIISFKSGLDTPSGRVSTARCINVYIHIYLWIRIYNGWPLDPITNEK